jgi:multiple sugar transport system substrate-binding protein
MSKNRTQSISRRQMLKLIGIGSAGLAVAACGGGSTAPTSAPAAATQAPAATKASDATAAPTTAPAVAAEQGDLHVLVCCATPAEEPLRTKFNTDFAAANPGVKVTQDSPPAGQNYFEKLQTLLAAGTMPDVFDMWEGYVQPYAANGAMIALDPFIESDPKIKKDDILPVVIPPQSYQGKSYAFIYGFMPGPVSLYYNVDHFEKAGVTPPTADWKWDDVRTAAKKLTSDKDKRWGMSYDNWFVMWQYWAWSNGGDIFNKDETKAAITDPKTVEAIQYWYDMVNVDKTAPNSSDAQALGGLTKAFVGGQLSMRLGNYWDLGDLKEAKDIKWKAVLAPAANTGSRVWYMHLGCWSIGSNTKMPNTAWAYSREFVLARPIEPVTPYIPPLKSLLPQFDTPEHEALGYKPLVQMVQQPGTLRYPGAGAKFDKIQGMIQAELDLAYIGKKKVADAMAAAAPKVDEELARK